MPLTIIQPDQVVKRNSIIALIIGLPGSGKTSTACMTSRPLLIDCDKMTIGQEAMGSARAITGDTPRVNAMNWDELASLTEADLANYDTVIVDTLGGALNLLTEWTIRNNTKAGQQGGGLSIKGWGFLKDNFVGWLGKLMMYGKNVVVVAHAVEEKGGDEDKVRVDAAGGSKIELFKVCDMMGMVYKTNKQYMIDFSQTDKFHGKNPAGFPPTPIPDPVANRDFLQSFMDGTLERLNKHQEQLVESKSNIAKFKEEVEAMDLDALNAKLTDMIKKKVNVREKKIFGDIIKKRGFDVDRNTKQLFVAKDFEDYVRETATNDPDSVSKIIALVKGSGAKEKIVPAVIKECGFVWNEESKEWIPPKREEGPVADAPAPAEAGDFDGFDDEEVPM